jgi:hypothetical protein
VRCGCSWTSPRTSCRRIELLKQGRLNSSRVKLRFSRRGTWGPSRFSVVHPYPQDRTGVQPGALAAKLQKPTPSTRRGLFPACLSGRTRRGSAMFVPTAPAGDPNHRGSHGISNISGCREVGQIQSPSEPWLSANPFFAAAVRLTSSTSCVVQILLPSGVSLPTQFSKTDYLD